MMGSCIQFFFKPKGNKKWVYCPRYDEEDETLLMKNIGVKK